MPAIALLAVIVASAVWVYWDASANHIGDIRRYGLDHRSSPATLALATLFLWPIAFPAYLRVRARLIELAQDFPNRETNRVAKGLALVMTGMGFMLLSVGFPGIPQGEPVRDCDIADEPYAALHEKRSINGQSCQSIGTSGGLPAQP